MESDPRAPESEPGSSSSASTTGMSGSSSTAGGQESSSSSKEHGSTSPWRNFETVVIPPPVLLHVTELLGGYLWRTDVPALVKEYVFHLLAQCLRMFHHSESVTSTGANVSPLSPQLSPSLALLMQLQSELRKLYDEETKSWSTSSTVSGTGIGLGVGDCGRFTTYFHSLLEVCLAMAEVTAPITSSGLSSLTAIENAPPATSTSTPPVPTSPMSAGKRKKLKGKRERERGGTAPRRSGSPRRVSESDTVSTSPPTSSSSSSATSVSSAGSASSSGSNVSISSAKPEDMLWFHRALTMSQILRYLTNGDAQGQGVTNDAIADAAQALMTPTAHSRLLVVTSIPTHLEESVVSNAIRKACSASGGLFKDEIYLPTEEKTVFKAPETREGETPNVEEQQQTSSPAHKETTAGKKAPKEEVITKRVIKGYAVIQIRSRTKVEFVKKALFRSKAVIDGMTLDPENPGDIPEEMMSVALVNQSLITEPQNKANAALEDFLYQKLVATNKETVELNDAVMIALTEIFHSCFISEQRLSFVEARHESGYICLGREQIMMQVAGNLLYTFLTAIRVPKKTFSEQVSYILRRYGIPKMMDKEE